MATSNNKVEKQESDQLTCGLIMPISTIDGCSFEHWLEVKSIITESVQSISDYSFTVRIVSDADDIGVIQKRIVQNIYSSDIVVCDVSCKNPNVMFELGMRLAFDKPTIIIKDDKTDYSFDTGIIEHLTYPRDLRFSRINSFKTLLAEKILATYKQSKKDNGHSTFLKNFGHFQIANLSQSVTPADKIVVEMLSELRSEVESLRRTIPRQSKRVSPANQLAITKKLRETIQDFLINNPQLSISDLHDNPDYIKEIEDSCDARLIFETKADFLESFRTTLNYLEL